MKELPVRLMLFLALAMMLVVPKAYAQDAPQTPAGFVVYDTVGDDPVADGELFLAVGPNDVLNDDIEYRLFYGLSANQPEGPLEGNEYEFGTTPGDGGGVNAFGFVLGGLEPGRNYTFWLYQYNSATEMYSAPAIVMAFAAGDGDEPSRPAAPAGFVVHDNVGGNPLSSGEVFLAVGPNDVTSANIEYRLFYGLAADEPRGPLGGTAYEFGTTAGDGGGVNPFGFVLGGLEAGMEYRFWLYQYNNATELYSNPAIVSGVAAGQAGGPGDGQIVNPDDVNDLQKFPLAYDIDTAPVDWADYTYFQFEGAELRRIENPDQSAGNESDYVLEYVKNPSGQPWGGFFYHLEDTVQTTDDAVFRLNVWSPRAGIQALMKLESRDGASTGDLFSEITVAGEWSTVEWDLSGVNREVNWDMVTVIMDLDVANPPQGGANDTWYLDDFELAGVEVVGDPGDPGLNLVRIPLPVDFEDQTIDWGSVFLGFEGAHVDVIQNPQQDADNDSEWVGRMVKNATIYWAGAFFWTEETFFFDAENHTITMDVWSPRSNVGINLKLEQSDGTGAFDSFAVTSTSGEWETMTWDYSGVSPYVDWDQITMIFDFHVGQDGDGGPDWTWYFDNITVNSGDPDDRPDGPGTPDDLHPVTLPLDFEDGDFNWNFAFFGFEGGHADRVQNPDQSDLNDSEWVGRMVKNAGPFWAGAFFDVDDAFSIDPDAPYISMKVWSPRSGVPILMKVEDTGSTAEFELTANTTTSGEWEEIYWNMSGAGYAQQWDRIVMIFDFRDGGSGDGGEQFTWYFDDLEVNVGTPTSTDDYGVELPIAYQLHQNYPNPFNPATRVQFDLPHASHVTLEVFNVWGQRVEVLASGTFQAGSHAVQFDASDLPSGTYFYRIQAGAFSKTQKMTLVK